MKVIMKIFIAIFLVICFCLNGSLNVIFAEEPESSKSKTTLMNRIDFENAYIMGQSIKSGAVYLLQRKKSELKSMLSNRTHFRKEILEGFDIQHSVRTSYYIDQPQTKDQQQTKDQPGTKSSTGFSVFQLEMNYNLKIRSIDS